MHFRLHKSKEDQELTNPVTPVSQIYKRGLNKEMFYQNIVNVNVSGRVAQWKLARPITQRSEDQNLALLVIIVLSIKMFKGHLLSISLFPIKQFKKVSNQAALENALRIGNSVDSDILGSTIFL